MSKTYLPSVQEAEAGRKWHHIDATGKTLGRLATQLAVYLMGKHKRTFTPNMDCGDFVVVTNAGKIKVTGKKAEEKVYFSTPATRKALKKFLSKGRWKTTPRKLLSSPFTVCSTITNFAPKE